MENVSYFAAPGAELEEIEFLNLVLEGADCDLHLDVNNVLVNSVNHCYDPFEFLNKLPLGRVRYGHVAGHYVEAPDLRIDTHGSDVSETVWMLAGLAFERFGIFPAAVERYFNIPPLDQLLGEVRRLRELQESCVPSPRESVG